MLEWKKRWITCTAAVEVLGCDQLSKPQKDFEVKMTYVAFGYCRRA